MGGYVVNFSVYTMAMIGLICFAVFVYKKIMDGSIGKKHTQFIEIEDTLCLNPRKSLHVVRAGNEKFLIASDMDRTSLISRLDNVQYTGRNPQTYKESEHIPTKQLFKETMDLITQKQSANPIQQNSRQRVHLEPLRRKERSIGISNLRGGIIDDYAKERVQTSAANIRASQANIDTLYAQAVSPRAVQSNQKLSTVTATPTMKDMAKKINQL